MSGSIGRTAWALAFELSPIVFTQGIAQNMPGGLLPILLITEALSFPLGVLSNGALPDLSQVFAHWQPMAGTELNSWVWGEYPFANQAVAANAGISQPKRVSMLMKVPAQGELGYYGKLGTMVALRSAIDSHCGSGGTFTVITPTGYYPNCLLEAVRDISGGETDQPQVTWQWDFRQPLLTLEDAQQVQSSLITRITSGLPTDGTGWGGLSPAVANPNTLGGTALVPSAAGSQAAMTAPLIPVQSMPLPAP